MTITYHGHSCFKLKGKSGTVVTDPYSDSVGFASPSLTADVVTVSHQHSDHNAVNRVKPAAGREKPFLIDAVGEYEVGGISVFGNPSFHDVEAGANRGANNIFTIMLDGIRACHLGDLGHELTERQVEEIGLIDVLFVPVGGVYTLDPQQAIKTALALNPSFVVPMHYKTEAHNPDTYGSMKTLEDFANEYGVQINPVEKLVVEKDRLPEEMEVVILSHT
ncbi:MAG: MBL fold metallo-hydrolase [Patescibacteria group bacterium]